MATLWSDNGMLCNPKNDLSLHTQKIHSFSPVASALVGVPRLSSQTHAEGTAVGFGHRQPQDDWKVGHPWLDIISGWWSVSTAFSDAFTWVRNLPPSGPQVSDSPMWYQDRTFLQINCRTCRALQHDIYCMLMTYQNWKLIVHILIVSTGLQKKEHHGEGGERQS